jgi:Na+-transporting NADH:ubiquinone oxidoreductase subunit B
MKALENLVQKAKKPFLKGGPLEKLYWTFDALETFLFVPKHTTHKGAHIRDGIDMKRTMFMVIVALIPALLFGIWNTGNQHYLALGESYTFLDAILYGSIKVLPLVIVSYGVGLGIEFLFCTIKNHPIQEGFLVSGMLIPLCMPVDVPLWMLAIATAFAVLIGKEVFGGTGMNILNVALTARAFLFFAYPTKMSGNDVWIAESPMIRENVDGFTGATALGELASTVGVDKASQEVQTVMAGFNADGAYSMANAFFGFIPGSVGETSALAILIGAALLIWTGIGSWKIMGSFLAGGLVMGLIFNLVGANAYMTLNPVHQILIGGFMFGMVFMATDPVTASQTETGKYIYGFLAGFLSILIRVFNPAYPEGVMMAILFMNVMAPLIDHYVVQANINRRLKRAKLASVKTEKAAVAV